MSKPLWGFAIGSLGTAAYLKPDEFSRVIFRQPSGSYQSHQLDDVRDILERLSQDFTRQGVGGKQNGIQSAALMLGAATIVYYVYTTIDIKSLVDHVIPVTVRKLNTILSGAVQKLQSQLTHVKEQVQEQLRHVLNNQNTMMRHQKVMGEQIDEMQGKLDALHARQELSLQGIVLLCETVINDVPPSKSSTVRDSLVQYTKTVSSEWPSLQQARHAIHGLEGLLDNSTKDADALSSSKQSIVFDWVSSSTSDRDTSHPMSFGSHHHPVA
eukprot:CAMPEP_0118806484 /NCGR_PEP_ID=MMETSP1161-20130426/31803_1 /TAXON_ID=249345 /ORGANISM="Picochlorum oklahomensis, Strain CCMP2329" /LENGTH=268 /DNA_ID=CAMNT_0006735673 /DNA_START=166 /DNA_END=972 /DNA_ORIENTATION=-